MRTSRLIAVVTVVAALATGNVPFAMAQGAKRPARTTVAPPAPVKGAAVEGITEYTLGNGLRVLLFPDPSKPTVTVNVTYLVGSRHEGYGETGMAHLLEHMLFKGSPKHPDPKAELSARGAEANGTTWLDRTNYYETLSATGDNLAWALDLEADRMVNAFVAKKGLETEFTVVRNEYEAGENSPFNVLLERTVSTAFLWHNYGHSTIGARSDIENVPIERLQAFYHRYYQPDNAILIVAGKFDPDATLRLVNEKLGRVPRPDRTGVLKIYPTYTIEPTQDGERGVTLRRVGDVQVAMAAYHVPAGTHADFAAIDVLAEVLGNAPSGRLYQALVETKQAAEVGAFTFQLREPGGVIAYAQVRKDDPLETARATLMATLGAVAEQAPTPAEVDRAKAALLKNIELNLTDSEQIGIELSEWAAMGDWRMLFVHRDRLKAVTPADVKRVAAAYLVPSNVTVGLFYPTEQPVRAEIPKTPDVAALVKDYKGTDKLVQGESFDASPANLDTRTTRVTVGAGLQLALLPKTTRGDAVSAVLMLRFGTLAAAKGQRAIGDFAADMLLRGTATKSRQEIKDALDRFKARVSINGTFANARITIETTRPNLPDVLRLVAELVKSPGFPAAEFQTLQREAIAQIEQQKSEPTFQASVAFQRLLNPYPDDDPRATPTIDAQLADAGKVTLDDVKAFHTKFYGADHGQLAVVGAFDPAQVTALATELFGAWKSPSPFERIPQRYLAAKPADIALETPDKANAMFLAGQAMPLRNDDRDYPALVMADYLMGGGFLNSRLATRIREKDGLSYGVGTFLNTSAQDSSASLLTYAIYAPENVQKLQAAFKDEWDKALRGGFTADEVDKAKQGLLQARAVDRSKDGWVAGQLADQLFRGRTFAFDGQVDASLKALSPAAVGEALKRHVDPSQFVIVKAGDFSKKTPAPAQP